MATRTTSASDDAAKWLGRAKPGYCNITLPHLFSSCELGNLGAFGLAADDTSGWAGAASACLARCALCPRCNFISLSLRFQDCSWYHRCELDQLYDANQADPAFLSAAVPTVEQRPMMTLSRTYPARPITPAENSASLQRAAARLRRKQGLCLSPAMLPVEEPHTLASLRDMERALLTHHVRWLPHHVLWLKTINPDNIGETLGTFLSALTVQSDIEHSNVTWQLAWNYHQKQPSPKHAVSLLRHLSRHI